MTLPASPNSISLSQVNTELGLSSTVQISLNDSAVRTLFGKASGAIAMSDGHGKANQFAFTISTNQTNANLRTLAIAAGWNQASKVIATINSGVIISSNSTGTPALTISGSFPGGVELVNNGTVVGMGGNGGNGGYRTGYGPGSAGGSGGTALSVSVSASVTNNGTLAGGGGGGGGGQSGAFYYGGKIGQLWLGGGGGGGGRSSNAANSSAGGGGQNCYYNGSSGAAGTYSAAGGGGNPGIWNSNLRGGYGGAGGGWGSGGSTGGTKLNANEPGAQGPYSGGGAGAAAASGGLITWVATGTRYGGVS